jgi:hypothetical protein
MRREGLEGTPCGKKKRTTIPDEAAVGRARDLLQRDFRRDEAERESGSPT